MVEVGGPGAQAEPVAVAAAPPGGLHLLLDGALRVAGGVVAVAVAATSALLEVFFSPLRVGGVLVGVSVVVAVGVNYWLPRFTVAATGRGWVALLPPLVWFALTVLAAGRRGEGDVLLGNWVGLVTIFAGSLAFAAGGYRLLLPVSRPL
jgi:hypothetical protein